MMTRATTASTCGIPPRCMFLRLVRATIANVQNATAISAIWNGSIRRRNDWMRTRDMKLAARQRKGENAEGVQTGPGNGWIGRVRSVSTTLE